jgi:hypothetical protein
MALYIELPQAREIPQPEDMRISVNLVQPGELPPYWRNHPESIEKLHGGITQAIANGNLYQDSLSIKWEDEAVWWDFPLDPVVSISGKNTIVRRDVLKKNNIGNRRGSIKEMWSQDDYEIEIAGVLMGVNGRLPEDDIYKLRTYLEARKPLEVMGSLFNLFYIMRIVIESYSLPFTKGMENQMYTIKAYSDDNFDLLQ